MSTPNSLPPQGAVGGVDVGWSTERRSSAAAQIWWTEKEIWFSIDRFRSLDADRDRAFKAVFTQSLLAVALDGPLTMGLDAIGTYRYAERLLTSNFSPLIGKPGQSSSRNGKNLNGAANANALALVQGGRIAQSSHHHAIHALAIAEAFPTSFLGVMIDQPNGLKTKRKASSDIFFELLSADGTLERLLTYFLPDRALANSISTITNHDDRAAFICAITALCVAANDYMPVGDDDGWIILPPASFVRPWARGLMRDNETRFQHHKKARCGIKLGLAAGMFPSFTLEEFNSTDGQIADLFYAETN